MLLTRKLS